MGTLMPRRPFRSLALTITLARHSLGMYRQLHTQDQTHGIRVVGQVFRARSVQMEGDCSDGRTPRQHSVSVSKAW